MKLIGKPNTETLLDIFQSLDPESIDEILMATAYINKKGFNLIRGLIDKVKTKIIVCLDPSVTDWEPLEDITKTKSVECRYYKPKAEEYFHPKMYIIKHKTGEYSVIIGSSNLTHGGMIDNTEANLYFERLGYNDVKGFLDYFNQIFDNAKPLNKDIIGIFKVLRDLHIKKEREWQKEAFEKRRTRELIPSPSTLLTSDLVKKVKKILKKEKKRYIEWFKKNDHCHDRKNHVDSIKENASKRDWGKLFENVWSVGGLRRAGPGRFPLLAKVCGRDAFRSHQSISDFLGKVNRGLLREWISYVEKKDWENASKVLSKIHGIAEKIQSELFCVYHGDEFGIKNDKSIKALRYLLGDSYFNFPYKSYDSMPYSYFNNILKDIGRIYLEIMGRQCIQIPLLLEMDTFF